MSCRYCKDKNKLVRTIAWAVYLAPLAFAAYKVLKDAGAIDKAKEFAEPAIDKAKEKASDLYETVSEKVEEVVGENPVEALKNALLDARNASVLEIKGGDKVEDK